VAPAPEARTTAGAVRGQAEDGLAVFRGIPFACPPVGELRFAAPEPPEPWAGTRDATTFGPPPPQSSAGRIAARASGAADAADWLTVNVWSPDPGSASLPVMVWVYGGAYAAGYSGDPAYDGAPLARRGVVVVSFNYRVGMEGFAHIEGAPANRGLLDQVAALRWVRDNVASFGGDPGNVTVFGESAGAGSIAALLAMDAAAGLFRRAIAQSVPGTFFSAALAADIAAAAAEHAGTRPNAADLAQIAPDRLVRAGEAVVASFGRRADRWGAVAHTLTPFSPVVDGEVLTAAPWAALAAGSASTVGLIVGHNRDECRLFTAGQPSDLAAAEASAALRAFAPGPGGEAAYRAAYPDADGARLYELAYSDWLFRMPSLQLAQAHAAGGGTAYLYELAYAAPAADGALGACHGLDVPLLFGSFTASFGKMLFGDAPPPAAVRLGERMRATWTAFAATGDPGWPAYTRRPGLTRIFGAEPAVAPYPEETSRRLWENHQFAPLQLSEGPEGGQ
jgi:para-nitrobenzyl esterase